MSKNRNAAAFAIGLGDGLMRGKRANEDEARRKEDDDWRREQRDMVRERNQQERAERVALADAVAPRTEIQGTAVDTPAGLTLYKDPGQAAAAQQEALIEQEMRGGPSLADARPAYGVTGTSVGNQITTQKPDVAALNSPDARMGRVVDATMRTDPAKALSLQNSHLQGKKAQMDMDEMNRVRRKGIETEGLINTVRAARTGDVKAVTDAFNATGDWKVDGDLEVKAEKRKAPWGAEVDTFTFTGKIKGPDGTTKPVRLNSLEAMTQLIPFQDMLKLETEVGKDARKHDNDIALEDRRHGNDMKEIIARGGQDRATADHRRRTGSDKSPLSREERMRYTTLFTDAGRRMGESQKTLNTLLQDRATNRPGTVQHQQAAELRETIKSYSDERRFYQGLLAESQTAPGAKGGSGGSGAAKDGKPAPTIKALPQGAKQVGTSNGRVVYELPNGKRYIQNN